MRDTIDMAREAGAKDWQKMNSDVEYLMSADALKTFEALVRADEREACAKVCEEYADDSRTGAACAEAIRARGQA